MAVSQFNKYVWLVDTIRTAGKISREEIDLHWAHSSLNEHKESRLPERTFFRYRNAIEEFLGIEIKCDRAAGGLYYIADNSNESQTKQWLLSQFAINNSLNESRQLSGRILYENIPEGTIFVTHIVDAMRNNEWLQLSYQRFDSDQKQQFFIAPYCLKVFKQRWYVLGAKVETEQQMSGKKPEPRIYALDRVVRLVHTGKTFRLPKNFDAQSYFDGYYGVFRGADFKPCIIKARVEPKAAPYLPRCHYTQHKKKISHVFSVGM